MYSETLLSCAAVPVTVTNPALALMIGSGATILSVVLFSIALISVSNFSQKSNFSTVLIILSSLPPPFVISACPSSFSSSPISIGAESTEAFVIAVPSLTDVI